MLGFGPGLPIDSLALAPRAPPSPPAPFVASDYQQTVLSQYSNGPTIGTVLNAIWHWYDPTALINDWYANIWDLDTAVGIGLDIWGRIVGVDRVLQISASSYFGLHGSLGASGSPFRVDPFYHGGGVTAAYPMPDALYRTVIYAKAHFNICDGSYAAINQALLSLFGPHGALPVVGGAWCADGATPLSMTYYFGATLNAVQSALVFQSGVLPTPAGVVVSVVEL